MDYFTPLVIGAIIVVVTLLVYWLLAFIIFYHLIRFGVGTQPKKIAAIFLLGAVGLFFVSVASFVRVDFQSTGAALASILGHITTSNYLQ
jgi:hypothetical protein